MKFQLQKEMKLLRSLAHDPNFKPASQDLRYRQWIRHGITLYSSLVKDGELVNFQFMYGKYGLERQDFYRYLQMRHYY